MHATCRGLTVVPGDVRVYFVLADVKWAGWSKAAVSDASRPRSATNCRPASWAELYPVPSR
jgi:hypothetical protein